MAAGMTDPSPAVIVLDVNETLSDMAPMAGRFAEVGLPHADAAIWFAAVLRDGMGLTAAGAPRPFARIAAGVLRAMLDGPVPADRHDEAVAHVLAGFGSLALHPDVPSGLAALAAGGRRIVTLSNGAATVAEGLLERGGVADRVEACLSVDDAGAWKPAAAAYRHAASVCGVLPAAMLMVAVHPWDIDGAARAGLRTAFVRRPGAPPYPEHLTAPGLTATDLDHLAALLG